MNPTPSQERAFRVRAEDPWVRLEAEFGLSDRAINVRYVVVAKTATPVLVYDGLRRLTSDGMLKYDPRLAYVSFEAPATLALKRIIPPLPQEKDVEMAHIPWAHRAAPGEPSMGEALVQLPAEEYSPYYPAGKSAVFVNVTAAVVRLVLAYLPLKSEWPIRPVPDAAGLFELDTSKGTANYGEVHSIQVEVSPPKPIPVRKRTDRFEPV